MSKNEEAEPLAELTRLLEAWGGEPARWPTQVRQRIETLAATRPEAHRLLAEARALDRVLDHGRNAPAQLSPAARRALAERIVAAALAERAVQPDVTSRTKTAEVIQLAARRRPQQQSRPKFGRGWPAAGLVAASLLLGLYLGGSFNLAPILQELADAAGLATVIDPIPVALGDDLNDEDTL